MSAGNSIGGGWLGAALMLLSGGAGAFDDANYPDLKGQWDRMAVTEGARSFDETVRSSLARCSFSLPLGKF